MELLFSAITAKFLSKGKVYYLLLVNYLQSEDFSVLVSQFEPFTIKKSNIQVPLK